MSFFIIAIKIISSLTIVIGSTSIGILKSRELSQRVKDVQDLQRVLIMLETEIEFKRNPLPLALKNVAIKTKNPKLQTILNEIINEMNQHNGIAVKDAAEEILYCNKLLDSSVLDLLDDLFKNIGTIDVEGEIKNIKAVSHALQQLEKEFIEYRDKYSRIYSVGGGLLGFAIVLIFI